MKRSVFWHVFGDFLFCFVCGASGTRAGGVVIPAAAGIVCKGQFGAGCVAPGQAFFPTR